MAETTKIIDHSPYVIRVFPAGDKWVARGLLGESVAAIGEGATADMAVAEVRQKLPAPKRQHATAFAGSGGFGFVRVQG